MKNTPRIVSLLPAATELTCLLGLEDHIVGISFECDFPASIKNKPKVVDTRIDSANLTPIEIEQKVGQLMNGGEALYVIDEERLKELRPDIILTQNLCQVCATSGNELSDVLKKLDYKPEIIFMSPHSLADIENNLLDLAKATGTTDRARNIIAGWHQRLENVRLRAKQLLHRPRVFLCEWVDPVYCSGHWLPEMVEIAGGDDRLALKGADSVRIDWQEVVAWQPEIIIVAPCGYNEKQAENQIALLASLPEWNSLPAVRNQRVYPVDGNAYFVRPGPRIIDGIEMLSEIFLSPANVNRAA